MPLKSNLTWLNDIDTAVEVLAATAVINRTKRAAVTVKTALVKQADPPPGSSSWLPQGVQDWMHNTFVQPTIDRIGQSATKHLGWGLAGAGIGAGVGALSQLAAPKKKRNLLSGMLYGGLGGAGLGAGASLIHSNWDNIFGGRGSGPNNGPQLSAEAAARRHIETGPNYPGLQGHAQAYRTPQADMQMLGLAAEATTPEAAYESFIRDAVRDNKPFGLPANHPLASRVSSWEIPAARLREHGMSPRMLRNIGNDDAAKTQFIDSIMQNPDAYMRTVPRPGAQNNETTQIPWTREDLQRQLPNLIQLANTGAGQYRWPASRTGPDRDVSYQILNEMRQRAVDAGAVNAGDRTLNELNLGNRYDQASAIIQEQGPIRGAIPAAQRVSYNFLGLGNIADRGRRGEGLVSDIERKLAGRLNITPDMMDNQETFILARKAGLDPVEVYTAWRHGRQGIDMLIDKVIRQGRTNMQGVPWTPENRAELENTFSDIVENVRTDAGASTAEPWLRNLTTGHTQRDILAGTALADVGLTGANIGRNMVRGYASGTTVNPYTAAGIGNPQNIMHALEDVIPGRNLRTALPDGAKIGTLTHEQTKYLHWVAHNKKIQGLRNIMWDPGRYLGEYGGVGLDAGALGSALQQARRAMQPEYGFNTFQTNVDDVVRGLASHNPQAVSNLDAQGPIGSALRRERLAEIARQNPGQYGGLNARQMDAMLRSHGEISAAHLGGRRTEAEAMMRNLASDGLPVPAVAGQANLDNWTRSMQTNIRGLRGPEAATAFGQLPVETREALMRQAITSEGRARSGLTVRIPGGSPTNVNFEMQRAIDALGTSNAPQLPRWTTRIAEQLRATAGEEVATLFESLPTQVRRGLMQEALTARTTLAGNAARPPGLPPPPGGPTIPSHLRIQVPGFQQFDVGMDAAKASLGMVNGQLPGYQGAADIPGSRFQNMMRNPTNTPLPEFGAGVPPSYADVPAGGSAGLRQPRGSNTPPPVPGATGASSMGSWDNLLSVERRLNTMTPGQGGMSAEALATARNSTSQAVAEVKELARQLASGTLPNASPAMINAARTAGNLPEVESAVFEVLNGRPGRLPGGLTLTRAQVAAAAEAGRGSIRPNFLRRNFGGTRAPIPRWAGYLAPLIAGELIFNSPGLSQSDREWLLNRQIQSGIAGGN